MSTNSSENVALWPLDFVDPKTKKTGKWLSAVGNALVWRFNNNVTLFGRADAAYLNELRLYSDGNQSQQKYLDLFFQRGDEKGSGNAGGDKSGKRQRRKGYVNIDPTIENPFPALKRVILSILGTKDQAVQVESTADTVVNKKALAKAQLIFDATHRPFLVKNRLPAPQNMFETNDPVKMQMYEDLGGFKEDVETAIERVIKHGFDLCDYGKKIEPLLISDLVCFNFASVSDVDVPYTGAATASYNELTRLIIAYTDAQHAELSPFFGVLEKYSIPQLRAILIHEGLSEKEAEDLLQKAAQTTFNTTYGGTYNGISNWSYFVEMDSVTNRFRYDAFMIEVLRFEYITTDTDFYKERKREDSVKIYKDMWGEYVETEKKKTITVDIQTIYEGLYIPTLNYAIGGKQPNQKRKNKKQPVLSVAAVKVLGKSIIESVKRQLDDIQIIGMKIQNLINSTRMPAVAIDIRALNIGNIGGETFNGFDSIKMWREDGVLLYNASVNKTTGKYESNIPLKEIQTEIGGTLTSLISAYQFAMEKLLQASGIAPSVAQAGRTPDLVGLGEQQMEATANALGPLQEKLEELKVEVGKRIFLRAAANMYADKAVETYYRNVIGDRYVDAIFALQGTTLDELGITITAKVSQRRKADILEAAKVAMSVGRNGVPELDQRDYFMIEGLLENGRVNEAQHYLSMAQEERRRKNEEAAAASSAQQAQQLQQLEITKAQAQVQAAQMLAQVEIKKHAAIKNIDTQAELQKIKATTEGKIEEIKVEAYVQTLYDVSVNGLVPYTPTK